MKHPIKILLADDSIFMRLFLTNIFQAEKDIEVIATASNGKDAVEKTKLHKPDVVVIDMNMGQYDGIYGIENIMKDRPTPIVILSAVGNTDFPTIEKALKLGAVDYVNKPNQANTEMKEVMDELVQKIRVASEANLKTGKVALETKANSNVHTFADLNYDVVVIGSSTGGPGAIEAIIKNLPSNMKVPILIAQHMPSNFVPSFAARLNELSPLEIVMARKGDILIPGHVYIAPGSRNMIVKRNESGQVEIDFTSKTFKEYNYPSVDCLMTSVAEIYGNKTIGVILTGMGKDGSLGMKAIKEKGGYTIAQNQETSVVYGMPKHVVDNGNANAVIAINEMGGYIVSCLS